jgi:uncharacterized protein (TIGR02001 family)
MGGSPHFLRGGRGSHEVGHSMKKTLLAMGMFGAMAVGGLAAPALADGEEAAAAPSSGFSGTLSLTSDYRFRGISQTDTGAAVQGSIDYNDTSGFFVGVWASNVDFNDAPIDARVEIDAYAGFTVALSEETEATLKGVYYWYPGADYAPGDGEYDYFEVIASLSRNFGKASGSIEVAWSPDYFGEIGDAFAVTGGLGVPLCDALWFFDGGVEASGHLGYQSFNDADAEDYTYWDLGLTASVGNFALDVRYVDTDVDDVTCGSEDVCDATVVFTGTFAFGG